MKFDFQEFDVHELRQLLLMLTSAKFQSDHASLVASSHSVYEFAKALIAVSNVNSDFKKWTDQFSASITLFKPEHFDATFEGIVDYYSSDNVKETDSLLGSMEIAMFPYPVKQEFMDYVEQKIVDAKKILATHLADNLDDFH
jgi:hypothetical protein